MNEYNVTYIDKKGAKKTIRYRAENDMEVRKRFFEKPKNKNHILIGIKPI